MKSLQIKSIKNLNAHYKQNGKHLYTKALLNDASLPLPSRIKLTQGLLRTKTASICRVRNRCVISNRARAIVTPFKLSRIKFRDNASFGRLMGVKKSYW